VLALLKRLNGKELIGDPKVFSLQERIFNTFCIIAFITMCFEVPFNFVIGLVVPALLCVFGIFISAFLYYLSRYKRKSSLGIMIFSIACNITFAINYFFNSGVFGPNLLLFTLAFLLIIAIVPKSQFKYWLPINICLVIGILIVEYFNPNLAPNVYENEASKFIDFGITYMVVSILTYFAISYIRKNYDYEKSTVVEKNRAIEQQNARILQQNDELERLNREKDKLFSIVTHDIRTPLGSIQTYLELLTEADLNNAERLHLKQQLLQITRDTSDMLTNVLSWSKSQMEGTRVELINVNIKNALNSGLSIEKNIAIRKGITLEIIVQDDLEIIADHNMFQLVLRNLVSNAIKFTQVGGEIKVSALVKDAKCVVMIKDNGLGIDPKQHNKLFELKASSTYGTNNERGIGLGLLLCKEFTALQAGEIWFESNVGKGSTFFLSFNVVANELVAK